ncbi:MAG: hypothetical protein IPM99_12090 [Rubrivivax sp.]|jgi:hypothetical protein|nr:hypothetical protein [Rubrivivax sp.]
MAMSISRKPSHTAPIQQSSRGDGVAASVDQRWRRVSGVISGHRRQPTARRASEQTLTDAGR